ncbi:MAG: DUF4372 domain-containing protein [Prolixibacteraceae bacterium]|nr:DUF4372 domain-containing protein [Burkholderiales bacterium]
MQELMKGLPRDAFERLVRERQADQHSKGFRCWDQLLAMVYAQLAGANSLRELTAGFNRPFTHHYPWARGRSGAPPWPRPTASAAPTCWPMRRGRGWRRPSGALAGAGEALLYLLDATSITLSGPGFDGWTKDNRTRHSQGIQLHLLLAAASVILNSYVI